ncbi:GvpL/GvpF family gas vesicle protein [Nitriliruptor alkaliphilus]|uniref:GvpL/GvpF family gas vesicle protein n=1 Tax=Nitriliruptor alkaliphilus TaxID=427918 RepID=UPI000698279E|nr:GvpL/GvpF family gas vesicle protein [Nitriliruptor alkaliphilus]
MIHLYTVATRLPRLSIGGIDDAPLLHVPCGPLIATCSEHPSTPGASRERAVAHAEVVAAVTEQVPAVPVRFGVAHADVDGLRAALAEAEATLLRTVALTGDAVEYVVRATTPLGTPDTARRPEPASVPSTGEHTPGRAYLEGRLAEARAARDARTARATDLAAVTAPLSDHVLRVADREGHAGPERCFLVRRATSGVFRAAAEEALADRPDLLLGGPWPPYTFAETGEPTS